MSATSQTSVAVALGGQATASHAAPSGIA